LVSGRPIEFFMNILIVVPWYKPTIGGVVLYIDKLSQILIEKSNTIKIIIPGENDAITMTGQDGSIPVFTYNMRSFYSTKHPIRAFAGFTFFFIPTIFKLRKFIRKNKINITLISYPSGYEFYFAILRILFSIKYVVIIHGSEINLFPKEPWPTRYGVNTLVKAADGLVAASNELLKQARANLKGIPELSRVIYMGVDERWKDSNCAPHNINGRFILTLAWATPVKGPDVVIRAFGRIKDEFPDVRLVMIGSGPIEDELRKLIDDLSLSSRIIRLGTVDSATLPRLFEKALFGVIPSRQEGFGVVALEFQLLKKAVIASAVGGIPEFVTDNYNGILVCPDDIEMLAEKMSLFLKNPDLCRKMGENGYRRVVNSFTLKKTGENYCRLIDEILLGRPKRSGPVAGRGLVHNQGF
jgi:glycosyltransferase involved in cell wall biosynthesis